MRGLAIAALACFLVGPIAAPALAGYGAFAFDEKSGKYGHSANEQTQKRADEAALKVCGSDACKVVFPVGPGSCGALATAETGNAWGGAVKQTGDAAKLAAIENCQKRTSTQCKVRQSECNKR